MKTLTKTERDLRGLLLLSALLGLSGCASPDALQTALEQHTVTYMGSQDIYSPSTIR
jgi:uncharacterized protein YceK